MQPGTLYIIATPIGNLEDITLRAIRILSETVDAVFCEDTRQTRKLLSRYNITARMESLHAHSSDLKINRVIDLLERGLSVAYVTDSGTPGLSDPGGKLVSRVRDRGLKICPIPGPSALTSLVSASGYQGKNIIFAGFLSKKRNKRRNELIKLREFDGLIVLYESPYRIKKLMIAIHEVFPESRVLIGRELSKIHEEFLLYSGENRAQYTDNITEKGEFAIAIFNKI
ncbi:MAG: 16S rRNA (cytidine(1402)-2'-O)-methyltransferase [Spirochaetes bacterium RBG_16_49_21]|nr:MAG: 16S rRNA (cytidine(1402)-2'-O)-methyltransferase [Spirochaetes bacterium RBG_16_49_21]